MGKYRWIDVKKNRFDGTVGKQCIGFDYKSKRYFEMSNEEVWSLETKPLESIRDTKWRWLETFGTLEPSLSIIEKEVGPVV